MALTAEFGVPSSRSPAQHCWAVTPSGPLAVCEVVGLIWVSYSISSQRADLVPHTRVFRGETGHSSRGRM